VNAPEMATLDVVASMVQGVTVRQLRAQIARGALPAARVGKCLVVRLEDVRTLYKPISRTHVPGARRGDGFEAEPRDVRELRELGFAPVARRRA